MELVALKAKREKELSESVSERGPAAASRNSEKGRSVTGTLQV